MPASLCHTIQRFWGIAALAAILGGALPAGANGVLFTVAPNGNDRWSGTLPAPNARKSDGPFATLERARDAVRALKQAGSLPPGGVTVELRRGIYERSQPFALTAEDSGTAEAPVVYRAHPGEEVRLVGGKVITGWKQVTDAAVLTRLEPSARGKVYQADLHALGLTDLPRMTTGGWANSQPGLEFFFQDRPMTLARWPNEGFVKIAEINGSTPVDIRGTKGCQDGVFTYEGDRPERWKDEKDLWLHGYWFWDWADQRQPVAAIDTAKRQITLAKPDHTFGYRKGQWYYAFNALSELDKPGEWYLDRETGILYFYPPAPLTRGKAMVSVLPTLATLTNTEHVSLRGLTLEAARGAAITINGGTANEVVGCTIRNVGSWAVSINGGTASGVVGCDIYATGDGGVSLEGGDRKTLTPAGLFAENNHIHHYSRWNPMCRPAISLNGVGNRASHNLIDNAPHQAIAFGGNDHVIEFNEIHSVCYESNDAGAIYAGRDWTMRGTVIRYNYLHHINGFEGRGCVGVYLDDLFSGTDIVGNVFYQVTRPAFIGGGRDNRVLNNVFVECNPALHVDARGQGWARDSVTGVMKERLDAVPYHDAIWEARYPKLLSLWGDEPAAPKGNIIARNISFASRWEDIEGVARPYLFFEDNFTEGDPGFVDAKRQNFQLRADSPVFRQGFQRIPVDKIGLYKDPRRASWPVKSTLRPLATPPAVKPARSGKAPVFKVRRAVAPITVDGVLTHGEWAGADPAQAMVVAQGVDGEQAGPQTLAWLSWDDAYLWIAVVNTVEKDKPISLGSVWGTDDAIELALRAPTGKNAPILVLRGYAGGQFVSSDESGAPATAVRRAADGVAYRARVVDSAHWAAEWRIPFASLGIQPAARRRIPFNLSARKSAGPSWVLWAGTGAHTWDVDYAGFLELTR